jgi:hypothetical protein
MVVRFTTTCEIKLWNIVSTERNILHYVGAAGILLHINRKFTMGKAKYSHFIFNMPSVSIPKCRSRYEADLTLSVDPLFKFNGIY